jgi:hypothetical protein
MASVPSSIMVITVYELVKLFYDVCTHNTHTMQGVSARLMASVPSSIMVITVYELVKRLARKDPGPRA